MMNEMNESLDLMKTLLLGVLLVFTGCTMPGENDFSTIPATNNPAITRDKGQSPVPGMKY